MVEKLENIVGARSKIRIIEAMNSFKSARSINSISEKSGVAYSVAYRDVHQLKEAGFVVDEDRKYRLNREHALYMKITGLFSDAFKDSSTGINISNRQRKDIGKIMDELSNHEKAQIIMHHNADPDAVGSAVALAMAISHMGIKVTVSAPLGISLQARQVLSRYQFHIKDEVEKSPSIVLIVDSSSGEQIGELSFRTNPKIVLIDHHQRGNLAKEADLTLVDTEAHSTAILVYRLIAASKVPVVPAAAPYILAGIVADTAFLRIADKNDVEVINELLNYVELSTIFDALSVKEDISERIAKLKVLRRAEVFRVRDLIIAFSRAGSFESRAATHLIKSGADVAFVSNVKKGEIRISARVRKYLKDDIDLVKVLKSVEGLIDGSVGGHAEAASANGKDGKCAGRIVRVIVSEFEKRANSRAKVIC